MDEQSWALVWFGVGVLASVLIPFFREMIDSGASFEWRKLVGQLLAVLALVAGQILGVFDQLQGATPVVAFAAGMGISYGGRQGQKLYDSARSALNP